MTSLEAKVSKKRRQEGDPEASKRKQKKQKKDSLSTELVRESSPGHDEDRHDDKHLKADASPAATESTKPKKDKKKKKSKTEDQLPTETDAGNAHDMLEGSPKKSKKSKKSKKDRPESDTLPSAPDADRLTPPPTADEAKPKKSKKRDAGSSEMSPEAVPETNGVHEGNADASPVKSKKSKKKKREENEDEEAAAQHPISATDTPGAKPRKRKDKSREIQATPPPSQSRSSQRLDSDSPSAKRTPKSKTTKSSAPPPVIMQEVARWVPLWPRGWHQPITAAIEQHFTPKLHRYDGDMGGVLLGHSNVCLNDRPTRKGAATQDNDAVKLLSVNEFGVGFCWLIADLELFLPKRGSWMEGDLILQSQGHVGVVCWDKFNASIETSRLPPNWSWVAAPEDGLANEGFNMDLDGNEDGEEVASATPLGYWVDEDGNKVEGKLRFRIKNYDVGLSGDHSFLCIEGTMLDEAQENRLREKELRLAAGAKGAIKRRPQRVLPEFSMTDLGVDEEAEKAKRWRKVPSTEEQEPGEGVEEEAGQGVEEGAEGDFAGEAEAMEVVEDED